MSGIARKLNNLEIFRSFSAEELERVSAESKLLHLKKNVPLYKERESVKEVYFVLGGFFKIQKVVAYELKVILNFLGRGEFLGIEMLDLSLPKFPATAITMEESMVLAIPRKTFKNILLKKDNVASLVHQQIGERLLELHHDRCMEYVRLPLRLADFLLRMAERQGRSKIMIPLSRKEISQRLGKQPETVIRIMSHWTREGVIRTENQYIEIINKEWFKDFCRNITQVEDLIVNPINDFEEQEERMAT